MKIFLLGNANNMQHIGPGSHATLGNISNLDTLFDQFFTN